MEEKYLMLESEYEELLSRLESGKSSGMFLGSHGVQAIFQGDAQKYQRKAAYCFIELKTT